MQHQMKMRATNEDCLMACDLIRSAMDEQGLREGDLALKLCLEPRIVAAVLIGQHAIDKDVAHALSELLGLTPESLIQLDQDHRVRELRRFGDRERRSRAERELLSADETGDVDKGEILDALIGALEDSDV